MRSILRAVHFLLKRPTMGGEEWDGMERGDKKGGLAMNQPTTYALGLFHGALLLGFVWIMFKSIGKK